jgi:membrane protein YdbS with pleckstrin-like domain
MYGALWRLMPGPWPVKLLISLVAVALVVVVCFLWLFPAIAPYMPFNGSSVQSGLPLPGPVTSVI